MCTLNDQDYENDVEGVCATTNTGQYMISEKKACKKCATPDVRNGYEHCNECFTAALRHKFKATLGKSKTIHRGDSVLVAHSGKRNSTVLLHLMGNDANEQVRKKLLLRPKVIYIDDGAVKGRTVEQREIILRSMIGNPVESTGHFGPTILIPLYRCLSDSLPSDIDRCATTDEITVDTDGDEALRKIFDDLEDDTARDELLRRLRRKLLLSVARKLGCAKVFLADTSTDLAAKVLADISTGRGARLSVDVGFSDTRCPDVTLLRPLKDFTHEDLSRYLEIARTSSDTLDSIADPFVARMIFPASVRSIARSFVQRLDKEFRSTVSTIHRTSEKLLDRTTVLDTARRSSDTCVLCDVTLDHFGAPIENDELSAVQATTFSNLVSARSRATLQTERNDGGCRCASERVCCSSPEELRQYLCYGCCLIFARSEGTSELPSFIARAIRERQGLTRMREEINEFLL